MSGIPGPPNKKSIPLSITPFLFTSSQISALALPPGAEKLKVMTNGEPIDKLAEVNPLIFRLLTANRLPALKRIPKNSMGKKIVLNNLLFIVTSLFLNNIRN
jgi:hypothetical protein